MRTELPAMLGMSRSLQLQRAGMPQVYDAEDETMSKQYAKQANCREMAIPSTSLLDCPFCGAPAQPSRPLKPTLEEALTAKPHINCSRPKCAGRHVCATVAEWQFRQSNVKDEPRL